MNQLPAIAGLFCCTAALHFVGPLPQAVEVDRLERNHVLCESGESLDQVIAWNWCPVRGEYTCYGWVLTAKCGEPTPHNGRWRVYWPKRGACSELVAVSAGRCCETWTFFDPEVRDREFVRPENRPVFP